MRLSIARTPALLLVVALAGGHGAPPAGAEGGDVPSASQAQALEQVRETLAAVRSLLVCYHAQHGQRFPTAEAMAEWAALLRTTTGEGRFTVNGMFGPYMAAAPVNPLTGSERVIDAGAKPEAAGWIYDERAGTVRAVIPPAAAAAAAKILSADDYALSS